MTERLYYDDASMCAFDARVVRVESGDDGASVWLDRTAFYPTSGGQPFDVGTLGGASVVNVFDDDDGDVVHVVAGAPPALGATVRGDVTWARRFDHMQQHTGQHLLSAVIEHLAGARTVSFHLGTESSTIDIDRELSPAQLTAVESTVNDAVWRDLPVSIRYASEEEARALPLRKESARSGTLRLVSIEGVDLSACGGTHVASTGVLGLVTVVSWERFKGGQRLEFLCGGRALRRFQLLRDTVASSIRLLSVLPAELPDAIGRLQADLKTQSRALSAAQTELARHEGLALANESVASPVGRLVARVVDGDALRLKALASAIASQPGHLAVLITRSTPALAVVARSADLTIRCDQVVATLVKRFSGKGGGKPDLAQCGGLQGEPESVLAAGVEALSSVA